MELFCRITVSLCLVLFNQTIVASPAINPAQRIIALSPHSVEMLYAIGAGDRIVATLEYADYPEAALAIPRIGNFTGIQIEKVVELQPDLIIAWKSGNSATDLKKLQSLGFNLFYSQPKNISEISDELIRLGAITGLEKNAQIAAQNMLSRYQKIKALYRQLKTVRVFYQLWHDPLRTVGNNSWSQSLITDCNGRNLFDDAKVAYPIVSLESVLVRNPQVIITPHHSGSETTKKEIWTRWPNISAVKNKKIFTINGDLLHRFSPRAIDGLVLLCQAINSARTQ